MSQLPIQMLIDEHKLILRMVAIVRKQLQKIEQSKQPDLNQIESIVEFFRTYADRYHHGKEEGILFNALSYKQMSASDKSTMKQLIIDHAAARKTITRLKNAKDNYNNDSAELKTIQDALNGIIQLYPQHIETEDKHFFVPVMEYFNQKEKIEMLNHFLKFNQEFIDKKYEQIVLTLENIQ